MEIRAGRDLGLAIAEARTQRLLSQQEVADDAGIHRTYLARVENGLTVQLLDRAIQVLNQLGATITVTMPDLPSDVPEDPIGYWPLPESDAPRRR